jgi:hypothetical protein
VRFAHWESICRHVVEQDDRGGDDPYFITGLRTFTDVKLVDESDLEKVLSISLKWPNSAVAKMVDGDKGAGVLDSSGAVSSRRSNNVEERSDVTSERIYAIAVRKVRFEWFSQDELEDTTTLKNNSWSYGTAITGANKNPKANKQAVEVNLCDEGTEPGVASDFMPPDEDHIPSKVARQIRAMC